VGYILAARHRATLKNFARSNGLVSFDFDGTLAPIVRDPDEARMRPETKELLKRLCRLYPCMVISGRAREDVRSRLRGTGVRYVVGNHGADLGDTHALRKTVAAWKRAITPALAGLARVWIEDKQYSLAIHYRQSEDKRAARRAILRAVKGLPGAKVVPAKLAFNLVPVDAPHKGTALQEQRARLKCDVALYVGDDATDEDVFRLRESLVGIRVGVHRASRAAYWLRAQEEIDDLLRVLAEARNGDNM
jgi:trehalose 6-phosphate phosphatase